MASRTSLAYLGKGELYPFQPDSLGDVALLDGPKLIEQSMLDILATPLGSRFQVEDYGSNLFLLTFIQNDRILDSLLIYHTSEALFLWEKRIQVVAIDVDSVSIEQKKVTIYYRILGSNEIHAFVYPFYKELKS